MRTTRADLQDAEGERYHIAFETTSIDNGDSGSNSASLTFSFPVEELTDDQIGDVFGAILDTVFAQKDRAPEIVERLETIMRCHLGEGVAKDDFTIRKIDQAATEIQRSSD